MDPTISDSDARLHAATYGHGDYPRIVDRRHELVTATGATVTPEAIVMGSDCQFKYRIGALEFYAPAGAR